MLVLDGNMKNHRDVCKATNAGFTKFDGLPGQVRTGCQKTPEFKSRFCDLHAPRVCKLSELPDSNSEDSDLVRMKGAVEEAVVQMIVEKKVTRKNVYYKV